MHKSPKVITVLTDCCDRNAEMRITTRVNALFGMLPSFAGVPGDLSLGGDIVDSLDAATEQPSVVIGNAAARSGQNNHNGSPFGAFRVDSTLVVTTVNGFALSFAQKLGLVEREDVQVFDTEAVLKIQAERGVISRERAERAAKSQFRSYEFELHLAKWLWDDEDFPFQTLKTIPDLLPQVWWIDDDKAGNMHSFGNLKTSIQPEWVGWEEGRDMIIRIGSITRVVRCYPRLSNIPRGQLGVAVGSSGYKNRRWLEIQISGSSAAEEFQAVIGSEIHMQLAD